MKTFLSTLALLASLPIHAQTVNNLLAPNTPAPYFTGASDGDLAGSNNISELDVHSLLYSGNSTQVYVQYMPWWSGTHNGSSINVGYNSNDPAYIQDMLASVAGRGVNGLIVDWYGPSDNTTPWWDTTVSYFSGAPSLKFAIMVDAGMLSEPCNQCNNQQTLLAGLAYLQSHYFSNSQYLTDGGKQVVFDFGMTAVSGINWTTVQNDYPNIKWIHLDNATSPSGFAITKSAGSFLWIDPPPYPTQESQADMSEPDYFYTNAQSYPTKIAFGGAFAGFDNSLAAWNNGQPQYIPQNCGATWLATFAQVNNYYSSTHQLPYLQLITWNDYEEGTEVETGIKTCSAAAASVSGHTVTLSLTHPETIDHFELWKKINSTTYNYIQDEAKSVGSFTVPTSGTYYLKGIGVPFMQNFVSNSITIN